MDTSNPLLRRETAISESWASSESMTLQGVINKSAILLLLCMGAAAYSWSQGARSLPLLLVGLIGGFVACLVGTFFPKASPIAAPIYAVLEGLVLGAISQMFEKQFHGIVVNAMMLTFGVLAVMLVLYATRTIVVTERLVKGILAATIAVLLVYVIDIVMGLFGTRMAMLHDNGILGIGISLAIVGIASFNLLIDFSVIENNVENRAPKYMEWYSGMALLVTLVWLYLEVLRLLSKLSNSRN